MTFNNKRQGEETVWVKPAQGKSSKNSSMVIYNRVSKWCESRHHKENQIIIAQWSLTAFNSKRQGE